MELWQIAALILVGGLGGACNAIAGGATLFTFPALMAVGLPPLVANATNYLAMLPSNAAALPAYRSEIQSLGRQILPLMLTSGAGALTGSFLLLVSDPDFFIALIPFLILFATFLFAFGDSLRRRMLSLTGAAKGNAFIFLMLFIASVYGGYFGAGLGIILLAIAQILGFTEFHVANGVKNLLATSFTVLSILVFGIGGLIAWPEALTMMLGSTAGGYFGGWYAKKVNQRLLRGLVIGFGLLLAAVYFQRTLF